MFSTDARVLLKPATGFREIVARASAAGLTTAIRRPFFLALVLASIASFLATSTFTLRISASAILYWSFVPIIEFLALWVVTFRKRPPNLSTVVDAYFTGQAAWILYLVTIATVVVFAITSAWTFLTTAGVGLLVAVLAWSIYTDFCFFRIVLNRGRAAAWRDVVIVRLIVWPVVVIFFAVPSGSVLGLLQELAGAVVEIAR